MAGAPIKGEAYVAYMLRLWQAGTAAGLPIWRASLENPHTGERLAFGDGKEMLAFLADLMTEFLDTRDSGQGTSAPSDDSNPA